MPNALIVFYSLDGDVRFLARTLAKELVLDSMELELVKPHPAHGFMKYVKGGFLAAIGATPPLRPLAHDAALYDLIFVGTPVWNSRPTPAVRSFLKNVDFKGKRVAFFTSYGDNDVKTYRVLASLVSGATVVGHIGFKMPLKTDKEQCSADVVRWAKDLLNS
ncbi:MAG: flavodoxin family protein [Candidatus Cryosericum sp.]